MERKSLVGTRFGKLVVAGLSHCSRRSFWNVRCDCGEALVLSADQLVRGRAVGCKTCIPDLPKFVRLSVEHGHAHKSGRSATYRAWQDMKARCLRPSHKSFRYYGGRGITVHPSWMTFEGFLTDVGERPAAHLSIERRNNDGNYEPGNCYWATRSQQMRNRRPRVTHA